MSYKIVMFAVDAIFLTHTKQIKTIFTNTAKLLGIIQDEKLTCLPHTENLKTTLSKNLKYKIPKISVFWSVPLRVTESYYGTVQNASNIFVL